MCNIASALRSCVISTSFHESTKLVAKPLDNDTSDTVYFKYRSDTSDTDKEISMSDEQKKIASEIVCLMTNGGPYPGLWVGEPMTEEQVVEYARIHQKSLPMQNGHTKNSLEMQNVRNKIYRRLGRLV